MNYFWFGHEDILVKTPDEEQWKILIEPQENSHEHDNEDNYDDGWIPVRDTENGKFWFDNFGERVGLSEDEEIQKITAELLDEMLELANTKESIFFMPPNQMAHIEKVLSSMENPPLATMPEICLLDLKAEETIQNQAKLTAENYYIFDWNKPNMGISRLTEDRLKSPMENIPAPVLMPAAALANNKSKILGHYTADKKLDFYETELELPHLANQRGREPGLGLIWVWGWGKKLWQWALPYTPVNIIDDKKSFKLSQEKGTLKLHLSINEKGKRTIIKAFDLRPPVIDWYLPKAEEIDGKNES